MYAKLEFTASVTTADAMADIVDVLTGETDVGNLTSAEPTSEIYTTSSVSGWTLWDDLGSDDKVLRAPYDDVPTNYKYIRLTGGTTSGHRYISWEFYRDWDEISHTGTLNTRKTSVNGNLTTSYTNFNMIYYAHSANNACTSFISSSIRHLATHCITNGNTMVTGVNILSERTRISDWDTISNGYSPIGYSNYPFHINSWTSTSSVYRNHFNIETRPSLAGGDYDVNVDNGQYVCAVTATSAGDGFYASTSANVSANNCVKIKRYIYDENLILKRPVIGFGINNAEEGDYGGDMSNYCKIYLTSDYGLSGDLMIVDGVNYRIWNLPSSIPTSAEGTTANGSYRFIVIEG